MKLGGNQGTLESRTKTDNRLFQLDGVSDCIVHNTPQDLEPTLRLRPRRSFTDNGYWWQRDERNLRSKFAIAESWATKTNLSTDFLASV